MKEKETVISLISPMTAELGGWMRSQQLTVRSYLVIWCLVINKLNQSFIALKSSKQNDKLYMALAFIVLPCLIHLIIYLQKSVCVCLCFLMNVYLMCFKIHSVVVLLGTWRCFSTVCSLLVKCFSAFWLKTCFLFPGPLLSASVEHLDNISIRYQCPNLFKRTALTTYNSVPMTYFKAVTTSVNAM